jgi:hypothetical protein
VQRPICKKNAEASRYLSANGASGVYHPAVAFPHGTAMRRTLHSVKLGELGGMEAHNAANKLLCPKQTFAFFRVT